MSGFSITFVIPLETKPAKDALLSIISPGNENDSNKRHFVLVFSKIYILNFIAYFNFF